MNEAQKSKRELKDVVGVFLSKSQSRSDGSSEIAIQNPQPLETQVVSFCSPFSEEETFALNLVFPVYLAPYFRHRYLVTGTPDASDLNIASRFFDIRRSEAIPSASGRNVKNELASDYFWIRWPDRRFFDDSTFSGSEESPHPSHPPAGSLIVVDLLRSNVSGFENTIRLLDQLVLVIRPRVEDLKNAYKVIKTCYYINRELETSILFNAEMTSSEVERIFAKLSRIVSEFLVLPIRCLGALDVNLRSGKFEEKMAFQLNLDSVAGVRSRKSRAKTYSLERIRFLQKIGMLMES